MIPKFQVGDRVKFFKSHSSHNDTAKRMLGKTGTVEQIVVDDLHEQPRYYVQFDAYNVIWIREKYLEGASS
ncbi:MAG: hypothetical protein WC375_09210 [Methanomassiliicoccales archaeon]|jgi:hypothetical protein